VTPEIAQISNGRTLLSVMSCVNGTGGSGHDPKGIDQARQSRDGA
jgi:hypothetical protein